MVWQAWDDVARRAPGWHGKAMQAWPGVARHRNLGRTPKWQMPPPMKFAQSTD